MSKTFFSVANAVTNSTSSKVHCHKTCHLYHVKYSKWKISLWILRTHFESTVCNQKSFHLCLSPRQTSGADTSLSLSQKHLTFITSCKNKMQFKFWIWRFWIIFASLLSSWSSVVPCLSLGSVFWFGLKLLKTQILWIFSLQTRLF